MSSIRLITFDLDNTLWPVFEVIDRAEAASAKYLQQRFPQHADKLSVERLRQLRIEVAANRSFYWKNLTRLRIDMLKEGLGRLGLTEADITDAASVGFDIFYQQRNHVTLFDGALDTLKQLRKRYQLGAITNGNANLDIIGIADYFDFHLSAESVGEAKPHPLIFQTAFDKANVTAAQSLHIGDNPEEDIDGARQAGMKTIWANLIGAAWPEHLAAPAHTATSFAQIRRLIEMLDE